MLFFYDFYYCKKNNQDMKELYYLCYVMTILKLFNPFMVIKKGHEFLIVNLA